MPFSRYFLALFVLSHVSIALASPAEPCLTALANDEAEEALARAEEVLAKNQRQREVLLCKGRAELSLGHSDAALQSFKDTELLSENVHDKLITQIFKGHAYKALGNYPQTQSSYEAALTIADQEKNQKFQVILYLLVGEILIQQDQLLPAQQHYEQALKLAANNNERADANEHLAQVKSKQGLFDDAIAHQVQALVMQLSDGGFDDYANAGLELGYLYITAKDYANAEKNLNKIIDKAKTAGDGYWVAKGYYYLGLNFLAAKQLDHAREALNQSHEICEAIGAEKLAAEVNLQLQKLSQP